MKVLLLEDVNKLGYLGDVVDVKDGYARNFLIPYGHATVPTEDAIRSIADEKEKRAAERLEEAKRMEMAAEKVDGAEAVIAASANEQGHLFGSVTAKAIAENLRKQGFEVSDEVVKLSSPLKEIGGYEVELRYSEEITANVNVQVVSEEAQREAEAAVAEAEAKSEETEEAQEQEAEQEISDEEEKE